MTLGSRVNGAAIDSGQNSPDGIVQIAGLQEDGEAFGIGHGGQVTVICRSYPSRTRGIRTELIGRIPARHRVRRGRGQAASKGFAVSPEAFSIEGWVVIGARACPVRF